MVTLSYGELFAGVGGIGKALNNVGFFGRWANEYDKHACITYRANHNTALIECDVNDIDIANLQPVDILTAGFPCQPFSVAGDRLGFSDDRGNAFYNVLGVIDAVKPSIVILENVKHITTHDNGNTYRVIVDEIAKRGYWFKDTVLNTATHANIPQNRERWFMVAFAYFVDYFRFEFPQPIPLNVGIQDMLDCDVDEKYYYRPGSVLYPRLVNVVTNLNTVYQSRNKDTIRENQSDLCPTLTARMGQGGNGVPIVKTSQGIRKLTPRECFRLQGFDEIVLPDIADNHLYKQAGNSVTIKVVERIAEQIVACIE